MLFRSCAYHGWTFDVTGQCVDQPGEPEGGRSKHQVKLKSYPVEELAGLVFAYLGPQPAPLLPRWDGLVASPAIRHIGKAIIPCNWLQDWENIMDPFHVPILHTAFSGVQFVPEMGIMPEVTFEQTALGMRYTAYRKLEDGREMDRVKIGRAHV